MARKSKMANEQPAAEPPPPADSAVGSDLPPPDSLAAEPAPAGQDAPLAAEMATVPAAPRRRDGLGVIVGALIVIVVLAGAAVAAWPLWAPRLAALLPVSTADPFTDTRMVGMADRLAVVEQRLEPSHAGDLTALNTRLDDIAATQTRLAADLQALATRSEGLQQSIEALPAEPGSRDETADAALAARLQAVEQNVETVLARLNDAAARPAQIEALAGRHQELAESVARLTGRIEQLAGIEQAEARAQAAAAPRADLAAAVAGLRQALGSSAPFQPELAAVQRTLGTDGDIPAEIAARAAQGVPTLAALRLRFDGVAHAMLRADTAGSGTGWWDRALDRVKGLVVVRRTDGSTEAADVDSAVSRAETALADDDLRAAVAALDGLPDARARLAAERMLSGLDARVARPAATGGGT